MTIAPGATIGIVGGGQLGKMLSLAAARLGYRTHVFAPDEAPCGAAVAARFTRGAYDDLAALERFAAEVDVATYEFENLPADALALLGPKLRPGTASLAIAQDRLSEKRFVESQGGKVAPWRPVDTADDLAPAVRELGLPLVLKSRRLGYDGKGQAWVRSADEVHAAWDMIGRHAAVAEAAVDYLAEFSVLLCRSPAQLRTWDCPMNLHEGGILRRSTVPAGLTIEPQVEQAARLAAAMAEALGHIGTFTVEYFATAAGPVVNEIAPRVHNSGHWTIEGAATSQFEQHVRAICGLPLGSTERVAPSVRMDNLIGDDVLAWPQLLEQDGACVHLYGKGQPRPGRKMGHVTRLVV
jgi:5-(carboxyamino)imidazole ribonucleotide synthase